MDIEKILFEMADEGYKSFNARLIPTVDPDTMIGVRTPELRKLAKHIIKEEKEWMMYFMNDLPHRYYEENNLHAFLIESIKELDECIYETEKFLPYVDNWATCDLFSPKVFKKYPAEVHRKAWEWIDSQKTYTIRYGVGILLSNYLEDHFSEKDLEKVASIRSDEYYVNMMIAWYFSIALVKQYSSAVKYLENKVLDKFIHQKSIQKAVESRRISEERKDYLRSLRIK